jgi:hypothetical protein
VGTSSEDLVHNILNAHKSAVAEGALDDLVGAEGDSLPLTLPKPLLYTSSLTDFRLG